MEGGSPVSQQSGGMLRWGASQGPNAKLLVAAECSLPQHVWRRGAPLLNAGGGPPFPARCQLTSLCSLPRRPPCRTLTLDNRYLASMFLAGQADSGPAAQQAAAPMSIAGDVPPGPGSVMGSLPSRWAPLPATGRAAAAGGRHGALPNVYSSLVRSEGQGDED